MEVCNRIHDALDRIRSESFDLVISDYIMPDARGDVVLQAARDQSAGTRVILMSGAISTETIKALGADGYIEKPFLMSELQGIIDRLFNQPEG